MIKTDNVVIIVSDKSQVQAFRFPSSLLTPEQVKCLKIANGQFIGITTPESDTLTELEQQLEDIPEYCLHYIVEENGYPQSRLDKPMVFTKSTTVFYYTNYTINLVSDDDSGDESEQDDIPSVTNMEFDIDNIDF